MTIEETMILAAVGAFAGLHSASWGAYKDSPYEPFQMGKFLRSIVLGLLVAVFGLFFLKTQGVSVVNLGVMYAFIMVLERAMTEFMKAYIRDEPQEKYKIPSTVHVLGRVIKNKKKRLLTGMAFTLAFILFTLAVFKINPGSGSSTLVNGILFGFIGGMLIALGGGLKDAPIEGFDRMKFMRSPFVGLVAGGLLSYFTAEYGLIMLAAMGVERMVTEAYKSFLKPAVPGKFRLEKPAYVEWVDRRRILLVPYLASWAVFVVSLGFSITL